MLKAKKEITIEIGCMFFPPDDFVYGDFLYVTQQTIAELNKQVQITEEYKNIIKKLSNSSILVPNCKISMEHIPHHNDHDRIKFSIEYYEQKRVL